LGSDDLAAKLVLVLRSHAQRGVSKDAPASTTGAVHWTILRDARLRIAPQDEARVSELAAARRPAEG